MILANQSSESTSRKLLPSSKIHDIRTARPPRLAGTNLTFGLIFLISKYPSYLKFVLR